MTKQEITNNIATLEAQIERARSDRFTVEKAVDAEIREVLTAYLKGYNVFTDGFELLERSTGTYWYIGRVREGYNYPKDELSLNLDEDWSRTAEERSVFFKDIEASFYTTSEKSTYELQRMVMIGKVGQMLLNKKDAILDQLNDIKRKYAKALSEASNVIYGKEAELRELTRQLREWERTERLNKVIQEGVEFKEEFVNSRLAIGRHEFLGVKKLKADLVGRTSFSKGAFCKLEITTDRETYVYHTKVKTEALTEALTYYRDRIVS